MASETRQLLLYHSWPEAGQATENRDGDTIKNDRLYQAVFPTEDDEAAMFGDPGLHANPLETSSKRYRELEAAANKAKEDREYGELKTPEERELFLYKKRIRQAEREKDFQEAEKQWLESVEPQLDRLSDWNTRRRKVVPFK